MRSRIGRMPCASQGPCVSHTDRCLQFDFVPDSRLQVVPLATFKNDTYPVTYPVRVYPDITHSLSCQLPVPNWDPIFAWTENREPVNPRVTQELSIAWSQKAAADAGMSAYNEGTHDDVNKHVWLAAFWGCDDDTADCDKDQLLDRTLHDYARLHFGTHLEDAIVAGIRGLEQDWIGRLVDNPAVNATFATFAVVQQLMMPRDRWNWRVQQLLYRANYDKFLQVRAGFALDSEVRLVPPNPNPPLQGLLRCASQR